MVTAPPSSPVTQYAERVLAGDIVVGKRVRQACERHVADLKRDDIEFVEHDADWAIEFFKHLKHSKGEWAGESFELQDWQAFIVGSLFGWKRKDGTRRYRTAFVEVARKNGKTTLAAGIGLLLAFFDGEPGADVYAAATTRDQAKLVWSEAKAMVQASPDLRTRIDMVVNNLHQEATRSKFMPLSAEANTLDGLHPHGIVLDELHAHPNSSVYDVLNQGRGARRQSLMFIITTAGYDKTSTCWEKLDYSTKVLDGAVKDDGWFAYVATIDTCKDHSVPTDGCEECDDWRDPLVWQKANPNLGVSVKTDNMESECSRAQQIPGEVNAFLQMRLDVWPTQSTRWLSDEMWEANNGEPVEGEECFAGLMVTQKQEIAALVLWFPETGSVLPYFWCPDVVVQERSRKDGVPYEHWAREGLLTVTDGNTMDHDRIEKDIEALGQKYRIREIGMKRSDALQMQIHLQDMGFEVVEHAGSMRDMSPGTKELEALLIDQKIKHGGHPILRWMASNIAVKIDAEGYMRPSRELSTEVYNGVEALIMAIGRSVDDDGGQEAGVMFV